MRSSSITTPAPPVPPTLLQQRPRAITWRSILLGLCGVAFICGLTPYNDYALNNTFLVGNNLPLGAIMLLFLFTLLVNGPLSRSVPKYAFSSGELTVAFSMTLVSCALPSSGLMRYFPASLVAPFWFASTSHDYLSLLESLNLPQWILPSFSGKGPADWMNDPIVYGYMMRWTRDEPIPYMAWIRPAITWGIFIFALYGALLFMVSLVRRQWNENERLPFPLAQIELALIEQPKPGRFFNEMLGRRSFWMAFGAVFCLHGWNALGNYWPAFFPQIPVYYNLTNLFSEPPWTYMDQKVKDCAVFFTAVGVTYFLSTSVAFSLWFIYIAHQAYRVILGTTTGDPYPYGQQDQHLGGIIAFTLSVLWIGRRQWRLILVQAFRGERQGEEGGRYVSYRFAFWGLLGCIGVMIGWLVLAGCTLFGAAVIVLLLMMLFFVITRIIAETGLVHGQLQVAIDKPWYLAAYYGWTHLVPVRTFYYSAMLQTVHYDFREVVPVYASHGLKLADQTMFPASSASADSRKERSLGRKFIGLLVLALVIGYVVSFASTLWMEYHYSWPQDPRAQFPVNEWGSYNNPRWQLLDPTVQYQQGDYYFVHNPTKHMAAGFLITATLAFLRLRFTWWPLHPIGFLMLGTYPGAHLWLSIFIGWMSKVLILRFGGSRSYSQAKPFFLGLIVGEAMAAGFWLILGILLSSLSLPYRPVDIMPG
jgi:hypothetical protein